MKKETRFNRKISDFFWAFLSWLPTIMLLCTFVLMCLNFNQVGFISDMNYLNAIFDIFVDYGEIGLQFETIWENIQFTFIPDMFQSVFSDLSDFFGGNYFFNFLFWQVLHLVFIAIVRLITNIFLFLPKIGNYFISKWSGD